jgi:hypothetical protein
MACRPNHDLKAGKIRKDGYQLWRCKECGRSALAQAMADQALEWAGVVLRIGMQIKREERLARDVMES